MQPVATWLYNMDIITESFVGQHWKLGKKQVNRHGYPLAGPESDLFSRQNCAYPSRKSVEDGTVSRAANVMYFFSQLERPRYLKLFRVRSQKAELKAIEKQGLTGGKKKKRKIKVQDMPWRIGLINISGSQLGIWRAMSQV